MNVDNVYSLTCLSVTIQRTHVCVCVRAACAPNSDAMRQDNQGNSLCKPTAVSQPRLEGRDGADDKLTCMRDQADK